MKESESKAVELGTMIKKIRKKKELSQKQLSVMIFGDENHNASISRIESGRMKEVKFFSVYNILKALEIDILTLIQKT